MNINKLSDNYKILIFIIFLFGLISYLSNFNFFTIADTLFQPQNLKGFTKASVYIFAYLFVFINLILFLLIRQSFIFVSFSGIFLILFIIDITYYLVGEQTGLSIHQMIIAFNETSHILGAIKTYGINILTALILCFMIVYLVILLRKHVKKRVNAILPLILLPLSYIGAYKVYDKSAYTAYEYLSYVKIPVYIMLAYNKGWLNIPYKKREILTKFPNHVQKFKNIILIVDESVRADYLSINGFNMKTTPFLDNFKDVVSLGIATSGANNSAPSQYILRNGLTLNDLPDKNFDTLRKPNVFQYAKNAGYDTYYLDAQVEYKQLQNFMSIYDLEYIDEYFTVSKRKPSYNLDKQMLYRLVDLLESNDNKKLVYIVKNGSHVPWIMNYPQEKTFFSPVLNTNETVNISNRSQAINTYGNSLRWSVDEFFKELLSKISLEKSLIIYTSDHSVNIAENNTNMFYGMEKILQVQQLQFQYYCFIKT